MPLFERGGLADQQVKYIDRERDTLLAMSKIGLAPKVYNNGVFEVLPEVTDPKKKKQKGEYFIMERFDGDLGKFFQDYQPSSIHEVRKLYDDIRLIVESMHHLGYFHRDLRKENILYRFDHVSKDVHVRLIDFGLSQKQDENDFGRNYGGSYGIMSPMMVQRKIDRGVANENFIQAMNADQFSIAAFFYRYMRGTDNALSSHLYAMNTLAYDKGFLRDEEKKRKHKDELLKFRKALSGG